jgi:hypothetical protein
MHFEKTQIHKFFRVAFFIFAFTLGIGLYALFEAPIMHLSDSPLLQRTSSLMHAASLHMFSHTPSAKQHTLELIKNKDDVFYALKNLLIEKALAPEEKVAIKLTQHTTHTSPSLFFHYLYGHPVPFADRYMSEMEYYVTRKGTEHSGLLLFSLTDSEHVLAGILTSESRFLSEILPFIRPLSSVRERNTLIALAPYTIRVENTDVRVLGEEMDPSLLWGIVGNSLVITGDMETYREAQSILEHTQN